MNDLKVPLGMILVALALTGILEWADVNIPVWVMLVALPLSVVALGWAISRKPIDDA